MDGREQMHRVHILFFFSTLLFIFFFFFSRTLRVLDSRLREYSYARRNVAKIQQLLAEPLRATAAL